MLRRGGYADQMAAEAALVRARDGADPEAGATLGEWLRVWVAGRGGLAESTRVSYTEHINVYIIPALGSIPLAELTIKDLNDFYLALERNSHRRSACRREKVGMRTCPKCSLYCQSEHKANILKERLGIVEMEC